MNIKSFTSLSLLLSSLFMLVSSWALYIAPAGRMARGLGWHFLGFNKPFWKTFHINIGVILLILLILHIYFNWAAIISHLKNSNKKIIVFTKEFTVACLLIIFVLIASYFNLPPLSFIYDIQDFIQSQRLQIENK